MKEGGEHEQSKEQEKPVPEVKPRRKRVLGEINDLNPKRSEDPVVTVVQQGTYIPKAEKQTAKKLTSKDLYKFDQRRMERPSMGKYVMIFPFNTATHDIAVALNRQNTGTSSSMNGPNHANYMKQVTQEVKQYYDEKIEIIRGNKKY